VKRKVTVPLGRSDISGFCEKDSAIVDG